MANCHVSSRIVRWRWLVTGQVQGVGFRPFVYRIARQLQLSGSVHNALGGVVIECQGEREKLERFEWQLCNQHPQLAAIREIRSENLSPIPHERAFTIEQSTGRSGRGSGSLSSGEVLIADITVDTATCPACAAEIRSAENRRHRYALTNCTECGPRFSIIRRVPYDRCNTTMSHFDMCPACRAEYTDPSDRRFHAQPIACPQCGPVLSLVDPHGDVLVGDPIELARNLLLGGRILAIKGLGGFHFAVRADDEPAVQRLRQMKRRDHKPLALMVASIEAARELVELSDNAARMMQSPACPIVLALRRACAKVAASVAPGAHRLGVMLPYTPLHHLLLCDCSEPFPPLVMTSGNLSDEPLACENYDAMHRLGPMCDAILWHDRPIHRAVDDSVVVDSGLSDPIFLRRARGFVPRAIELPVQKQIGGGICVGAELKSTVAIVRDGTAILSHHLGDLIHPQAFDAFRRAIDDLQNLFGVQPHWIAHDLHPMYVSTTHAKKLSIEHKLPLIGVQHHHAHAASLMAEHGIGTDERILAVVCDGTGFGPDGTIWGGELLSADLVGFERLAHLRPLRLPGGDAAARDTARCGLALLHQAWPKNFADRPAAQRLVPDANRRAILSRMVRDDIACAPSSGAGRIFDGVAALLGLCDHNHFEAQAAMSLEAAAHRCSEAGDPPGSVVAALVSEPDLFQIGGGQMRVIDLARLVRHIVRRFDQGESVESLAALFHEQFARAWAKVAIEASQRTGLKRVGMTGGVFCNVLLTRRLSELLSEAGLEPLRHRIVPPNDGGLSLGQGAIASARVARGLS